MAQGDGRAPPRHPPARNDPRAPGEPPNRTPHQCLHPAPKLSRNLDEPPATGLWNKASRPRPSHDRANLESLDLQEVSRPHSQEDDRLAFEVLVGVVVEVFPPPPEAVAGVFPLPQQVEAEAFSPTQEAQKVQVEAKEKKHWLSRRRTVPSRRRGARWKATFRHAMVRRLHHFSLWYFPPSFPSAFPTSTSTRPAFGKIRATIALTISEKGSSEEVRTSEIRSAECRDVVAATIRRTARKIIGSAAPLRDCR